jgi:hypothetical protein
VHGCQTGPFDCGPQVSASCYASQTGPLRALPADTPCLYIHVHRCKGFQTCVLDCGPNGLWQADILHAVRCGLARAFCWSRTVAKNTNSIGMTSRATGPEGKLGMMTTGSAQLSPHRRRQPAVQRSLLLVAVIVLTASFGPRIRSCPGFAPRLPAAPPRAPLGDRGAAAASTGVQARRSSPRQLTRLTGKISASESPASTQPHHLHHHQQPCTHDRPQHLKMIAVDKATAPSQPPRQQPGLRCHEK